MLVFGAYFEKPVFKENGRGRHQMVAMLIHYTFTLVQNSALGRACDEKSMQSVGFYYRHKFDSQKETKSRVMKKAQIK